MHHAERQTRSRLMELFARHGLHPRSDLGQNFLIDLNLLEYIVQQAELGPGDVALEVGAGTGGLTVLLAQRAGAVVSVEYDRNVFPLAADAAAPYPNVTLLNCDVLRNKNNFAPQVLEAVDAALRRIPREDAAPLAPATGPAGAAPPARGSECPSGRLKLVANLPYNVATPVISNLVASELPWERMVVTIQLELAERMTARPATADYSALSAWLQAQCRVTLLKRLKPAVFWPRPKVNSAIIGVLPDSAGRDTIQNRRFFQDFLRRMFQHRRKLLRSTLAGTYKRLEKPRLDALLAELGLTEQARAEELDPAALVRLSNRLHQLVGDTESTE